MTPAASIAGTPPTVTPTSPRLTLCTCDHEQRGHVRERRGWTVCLIVLPGLAILGYGAKRRRCPCVRFVEAAFARQQIPLFETSVAERR